MEEHPAVTRMNSLVSLEGRTVELPMRKGVQRQHIFYIDSAGAMQGRTFDASENLVAMVLQPAPRKPNTIRFTMCPLVRSTRKRLWRIRGQGSMRVRVRGGGPVEGAERCMRGSREGASGCGGAGGFVGLLFFLNLGRGCCRWVSAGFFVGCRTVSGREWRAVAACRGGVGIEAFSSGEVGGRGRGRGWGGRAGGWADGGPRGSGESGDLYFSHGGVSIENMEGE
jgi:hypothetical protein